MPLPSTACVDATPPVLHAQMPLMVVVNAASGAHQRGDLLDRLRGFLHEAGQAHEFHVVRRPRALPACVQAAAQAAQQRGGALVAVGGDGSINTVAAEAWRLGLPLGVVPQGTFNYFARAQAIAQDEEAALRQVLDGLRWRRLRPVQVGLLNQQLFLVNASVGLYPQLLQDREVYKQRWGRRRWVAALAALATLMGAHPNLRLRMRADAAAHTTVRTPTLFVGNNPLQLDQLGLPEASKVGQGALLALTLAPAGRWALLKLALLGGMGRLADAQSVQHAAIQSLWASPVGPAPRRGWRALRVAIDGETRWMVPPLHFEVAPRPLWLLGADLRAPPGPA